MKRLLLMFTVFAFATVMAASSNRTCSGVLVDQDFQYVSGATITCDETAHSVFTDENGNFSGLKVLPNTVNTVRFFSSSGQSLGLQEIEVQSSNMIDVILQTSN